MFVPTFLRPFNSLSATFLNFRAGQLAGLRRLRGSQAAPCHSHTAIVLVLLVIALLSSCKGMRPSGYSSEQGLGPVPLSPTSFHPASPRPDAPPHQKLRAAFHRLPLSFIPNRGQVDERVQLYGRSGSASFFFARDEVVYSLVQQEEKASWRKASRSTSDADSSYQGEEKDRGHAVRLQFVGADLALSQADHGY
ncbi:MAG: hypothetical protein HYY20_03300 [Candidatus Tectomicrobia bacterium]|uniref:DUF7948 domain-containing protein n=1 Tax=Tectimicrobiota bacterium TaxID=2528274 RepID=A0A932CM89_UNCTE|nr:hypothetical protein [Candidatus Tectomicrobia bacterium]